MEEAFILFVQHFPPAENLQVANGFKSLDEIRSLLLQWMVDENTTELLTYLSQNSYVSEVMGDKVVYLHL